MIMNGSCSKGSIVATGRGAHNIGYGVDCKVRYTTCHAKRRRILQGLMGVSNRVKKAGVYGCLQFIVKLSLLRIYNSLVKDPG